MFLSRCNYKNSCFTELVYSTIVLVLIICSFKNVPKGFALEIFIFWGLVVGIYIAFPLRFAAIDLLFISKVLIFELTVNVIYNFI